MYYRQIGLKQNEQKQQDSTTDNSSWVYLKYLTTDTHTDQGKNTIHEKVQTSTIKQS